MLVGSSHTFPGCELISVRLLCGIDHIHHPHRNRTLPLDFRQKTREQVRMSNMFHPGRTPWSLRIVQSQDGSSRDNPEGKEKTRCYHPSTGFFCNRSIGVL